MSLDEWDTLEFDPRWRHELVGGVVVVVPKPTVWHQVAGGELYSQLRAQHPPDLHVLYEIDVITGYGRRPSVRSPDIVVVSTAAIAHNRTRLDASDVVLAVEVLSPGTARTDTVTKLAEYADAGIGAYWIIDPEPPVSLTAYVLFDGHCEITAKCTGQVSPLTPFPLTLDLDSLLA